MCFLFFFCTEMVSRSPGFKDTWLVVKTQSTSDRWEQRAPLPSLALPHSTLWNYQGTTSQECCLHPTFIHWKKGVHHIQVGWLCVLLSRDDPSFFKNMSEDHPIWGCLLLGGLSFKIESLMYSNFWNREERVYGCFSPRFSLGCLSLC